MVVVDAHMHLNGTLKEPLKYPALKNQPTAKDQTCFAWFGSADRPDGDASVEALRERMANSGVDRAVNVTPGWCGWDNSYTMDVLRGNEDWLAAVVLIDPLSPDGPAELARLAKEGASGLRIQPPCTGPLVDPRQTPLWQAANDLGITVQVNLPQTYLDEGSLHAQPGGQQFCMPGYQQVAQRAREFPDTKIVLDHCGWMSGATPTSVDAVLPLAQFSNVYAKITFGAPKGGTATPGPVPWPRAAPLIRQVIDAFGSDRCLGASNFCGEDQKTYNAAIELFGSDFDCAAEERANICGHTALKLFKWKPIAAL